VWLKLSSPAKSVQTKPNKIAWICLVLFVRIGTFQWVMAIPNKKLASSRAVCRLSQAHSTSALRATGQTRVRSGDWIDILHGVSAFGKTIAHFLIHARAPTHSVSTRHAPDGARSPFGFQRRFLPSISCMELFRAVGPCQRAKPRRRRRPFSAPLTGLALGK
jgi:hypothetical protein